MERNYKSELERIFKLMTKEVDSQFNELRKELGDIEGNHHYCIPPIINLLPEDPADFDKNTPKDEIYRELSRLSVRTGQLFALIDKKYLKSAIAKYNALIPLIDIKEVKETFEFFKEWTELKLENLQEIHEMMDKEDSKQRRR